MIEDRVREALLYERRGDKVQCHTCERRCLIPEGETGFCSTRKNVNGQLYTICFLDILKRDHLPMPMVELLRR